MNVRSARTARLALALLAVAQADAGFQTAFSEYNAGHYDAAHAQFLALAELGDCSSQFNLARDGDPAAQYWVGRQLRATAACHSQASGSVWLQHAAAGGSAAAQLLLASDLLSGAPSAAQVQRARALLQQAAASDGYYVSKHVAALLAASPIAALRDPVAAMSLARKLLAGEIQSDPQMFEAVAAVYAANGDFRGAVAQQRAAMRKARDLGWNTRAMDQRLGDYRGGRAWQGELFAPAPAGVP